MNDSVETKLIKLREATAETEKLLYGDLVGKAWMAAASPDLSALKLQLEKLTMVSGFDCFELAKILTTIAKLENDSRPVQDASRWLIGVENKMPPALQNPAGLVAIQKAAEVGNTKFFIQLGERLRKKRKNEGGFSNLKWTLAFSWQPVPRLNWPGLAYCKSSAVWDFLEMCSFSRKTNEGKNYLSNLAKSAGLIFSRQNRFIRSIKVKSGHYSFS